LAGGQTVTLAGTTTLASASPNPVAFGSPVTITATVTANAPATGTPTGTVQFKNGSTNLGPAVNVVGGQASLTISTLAPGQTITAVYSGDANFLTSTGTITPVITFGHSLSGGSCTSSNMTISGGSWLLSGVCIGGTLSVTSGTSVAIVNSTIKNQLTVTNPGTVAVCGSTIVGNTSVSGATGFVLLGDPRDDGCAANSFKNVSLSSNTAGVELDVNAISGNVSLTSNKGGGPFPEDVNPSVEANQIAGNLACTSNVPPPTNNGRPNAVNGNRTGQCAGL
jgi:hypothetical protein